MFKEENEWEIKHAFISSKNYTNIHLLYYIIYVYYIIVYIIYNFKSIKLLY